MASPTRIDLLYIDHCPSLDATVDRLRAVAKRLGLEIELRLVRVASEDDAQRLRFLGSPTLRLNDVDIDKSAAGRSDFGLCCRVYGRGGVPPEAMIEAALKKHV